MADPAHTVMQDLLASVRNVESMVRLLDKPPNVADTDKQLQMLLSNYVMGLKRLEEAAPSLTQSIPRDLLDHIADPESNNPDLLVQSHMQEVVHEQMVREVQGDALRRIAQKLSGATAAAPTSASASAPVSVSGGATSSGAAVAPKR